MSALMQKLLGRVYMAPADDGEHGSAGGIDLDLDDDDDDDDSQSSVGSQAKPEVKVGEQEDGSVILELGDEEDGQSSGESQPSKETSGEEGGDDEKALEEKRAARRQERQDRKARQKEREESQKRELAAERAARQQLEARLAALEGRDRSREISTVEGEILANARGYQEAQRELQEAIEQQDGAAATAAQERMLQARERHTKLVHRKVTYEEQQKAPRPNLNPDMVNHAQKFMNEHKWYSQTSSDVDSNIVTTLDNALAGEGWDPATPQYWDELRARVKKYLPHRVAGGKVSTTAAPSGDQRQATPARQQKAVVGGGGGESNGAGKGTFTLSAERVKAIKDAGMWDDPKARSDMVKRFRDFDKQQGKGK